MVPEWIISLASLCLLFCKELQNIPGSRAKNPLEEGLHGDVTAAILAIPFFAKHLHFLRTAPSPQSSSAQHFWHQKSVSWKAIFPWTGGWKGDGFGNDSLKKCATRSLAHAVLRRVCIPMRIYCHGLSDRRWSSGSKVSEWSGYKYRWIFTCLPLTACCTLGPNWATEQYCSMARGLGTPVTESWWDANIILAHHLPLLRGSQHFPFPTTPSHSYFLALQAEPQFPHKNNRDNKK